MVKINNIEIHNWKCFKFKYLNFNDSLNLYEQENGFGKSSIMQAIIYCLYGTLPDSNSNNLKNDTEKPIELIIELEDTEINETYKIKREIINPSVKNAYFSKNGAELQKVSIASLNDLLEKICGTKNIFSLIWSNEPLWGSDIFNLKYIKENILSEDFIIPNKVLDILSKEKFALNKRAQLLSREIEGETLDSVEKKIKLLTKEQTTLYDFLKNDNNENFDLNKAIICLEAKKELEKLNKESFEFYSKEQILEYEKLLYRKDQYLNIIKNYSASNNKLIEYFKIFLNPKSIIESNDGTCPLCGGELDFEKKFGLSKEEIINNVNSISVKENEYEDAVNKIEIINNIDKTSIELSKKKHDLINKSLFVENPEEIINKAKESKKEKWNRLDEVNKELDKLTKLRNSCSELLTLNSQIAEYTTIQKVINDYIITKTDFLLSSAIEQSINMLSNADKKYLGMYYNVENDCFDICLMKNDEMKILSHKSLSSGERTLVALSLIISFRNILREIKHIPGFLLLDESLAALDKDHLNKCFELLKSTNSQYLIINHN